MTGLPDNSQAEPTPQSQTESSRQQGGAGSGTPPPVKTAVGFEGRPSSQEPKIERVFGIDFGEETTRIAVLRNGRPFLTMAGIFSSEMQIEAADGHENACSQVSMGFRSKLLKPKYLFPDAEAAVCSFFKNVHRCIANAANSAHPKAVLTVPAYYSSHQRVRLKRCAESCGLQIIGLINDYAAVVLSFVAGRPNRSGTILVLSIGADAVSTAVVKVQGDLIETVCSRSKSGNGGAHIADSVANAMLQKFDSGSKLSDLPLDQFLVWRARAQDLLFKHAAGHEQIMIGDDVNQSIIRMSRNELLDILSAGFESALGLANQVVEDAGINRTQFDFVLIVGGIVGNSVVAKYLAQSFPRLHRMILNADMAAAFGAALRAGVLEKQIEEPLIWDVLAQPVYKIIGASRQIIIPSGTSIPVTVQTAMTSVESHIGQEIDNEMSVVPTENVVSGTRLDKPTTIEVSVTADGIIEVAALAEGTV
jgi:molecular chaperone DnaK (HSP70)